MTRRYRNPADAWQDLRSALDGAVAEDLHGTQLAQIFTDPDPDPEAGAEHLDTRLRNHLAIAGIGLAVMARVAAAQRELLDGVNGADEPIGTLNADAAAVATTHMFKAARLSGLDPDYLTAIADGEELADDRANEEADEEAELQRLERMRVAALSELRATPAGDLEQSTFDQLSRLRDLADQMTLGLLGIGAMLREHRRRGLSTHQYGKSVASLIAIYRGAPVEESKRRRTAYLILANAITAAVKGLGPDRRWWSVFRFPMGTR